MFSATGTKGRHYLVCLVVAVIMLWTLVLVSCPQLYLAISDSLNWRLGTPSALQARLETTLRAIHLRGDSLIGDQSTLLFGDSHLHSLPTSLLEGAVVNYAIGGETAEHLAERVTQYKSLDRVRQVVLLSGRNDLRYGKSPQAIAISMGSVLGRIPAMSRVAIVGIPPMRHADAAEGATRATNHLLARLCADRAGCVFVDTQNLADSSGALRADFAMADGFI
ncbi:SGNH/GDSL hydrolase family protein [Noviherbaspirillum sedimenti]|uniref:SGNH hydrolase-type esterase domain-containing protein n=1 Tax=Noviherbaspirillum sedimenti TaxID=2320865 RepID=A0A3A3G498_9BURK|nr:GDSL-type esterase/lipase family protein [Noviherbaspirillum sedimenti]RJG02761.1 hypothetical protein D3878_15210 [Noviherbaspirillum sedimenti]